MSALRRVSLVPVWDGQGGRLEVVPEPEPVSTRLVLGADDCAVAGYPLSAVDGILRAQGKAGQ